MAFMVLWVIYYLWSGKWVKQSSNHAHVLVEDGAWNLRMFGIGDQHTALLQEALQHMNKYSISGI